MSDNSGIAIPLTRGMAALVSAEDAERVKRHKWYAHSKRCGYYAARGERQSGKKKNIYLHHFLMNALPGQCVDHINGNTLDNRRQNLRFATNAQNLRNQRPKPGRFKGIWYIKSINKWGAQIRVDGTLYHLGSFPTAELAARAYDAAAVKMFGEFARLNFPA